MRRGEATAGVGHREVAMADTGRPIMFYHISGGYDL